MSTDPLDVLERKHGLPGGSLRTLTGLSGAIPELGKATAPPELELAEVKPPEPLLKRRQDDPVFAELLGIARDLLAEPAPQPAAAPDAPVGKTGPATPTATPTAAAPIPAGKTVRFKGLVLPLPTKMPGGSEFGISDPEGAPDARGQRFHAGKDWFAPAGSTVVAPVTGRVIEAKASRGTSGQVFGGTVKIQDARGRVFVFRHVVPGVQVGRQVRAGVPVATVSPWEGGSPHAHIEIWRTRRGGYTYENMVDPASVFGG